MNEVVYRVKQSFKYAGKFYQRGDEFVPQNLRNDKLIIEHMCRVEPVKGSENAAKHKQSGKVEPGIPVDDAGQLHSGHAKQHLP